MWLVRRPQKDNTDLLIETAEPKPGDIIVERIK